VTTYHVEFGHLGDGRPVPDLTVDYDPAADDRRGTGFERAVAEHAIPYLRPVLEKLGHPEYADCIFVTGKGMTHGHFMWIDLVAGQAARFCPARITAQASDNHAARKGAA